MSSAPAILAAVLRIAKAVEALRDANGSRRRGYGPADLLTMEEGAQLCRMGRVAFEQWSLDQGLHRMAAGRGPFVVAGEVVAALEHVQAPQARARLVHSRTRGGLAGLPRS